jgi:hypothetical protein
VKLALEMAVPYEVRTEIGPVVAFDGTVAVICVELITLPEVIPCLPKATPFTLLKFVPVMVTNVPMVPLTGVNDVTVGGRSTVKLADEVAVPDGVVTEIGPFAALDGILAVICVEPLTVKEAAATPPKSTAVAPVKFVPVIVTSVPGGSFSGTKFVMVGGVVTVKLVDEVAVP